MKKTFFLATATLIFRASLALSVSGSITTIEEIYPGYTEQGTAFWCSESISYTEGGVTFTFPSGLFTAIPTVVVSVSSSTYNSSGLLGNVITDLTTDGCKVYVTVGTMSAVGEALTDSVKVHIWVVGTAY